jgi:hypothetical protein
MRVSPTRGCLALLAVLSSAAFTLLETEPLSAAGDLCPEAYFELIPTPYELPILNAGWQIPTTGTWTEVHPNVGDQHPQYQYFDEYPDGLITKAEGFIEYSGAEPWFFAGVGTMLHMTPVEIVEGQPLPIGDPIVAWWSEFHFVNELRSDGRMWFMAPDSVLVLAPNCCEWVPVMDYLAGGVVGNGPPTVLQLQLPSAMEPTWHFIDAKNCGLWVTPNLATSSRRASWGGVKIRYR